MRTKRLAVLFLVLAAGAAFLVWRSRGHGVAATEVERPTPAGKPVPSHGMPPMRISPAVALPSGDMQLSGRIVSRATRAGIAGAEITFLRDGQSHSVVASPDGGFVFEPPAPGAYQLATATAAGFLPFAPAWGDSPLIFMARAGYQIHDVSIELSPEKSITAKVVDPAGAPVPAATIVLDVMAAGNGELSTLPPPDKTDDRGTARFRAPIGTMVEARHPAFDPARELVTADAWRRGELTLRLRPRSSSAALAISGKVIDGKDAGMAGVQVTIRHGGDPFSGERGMWSTVSDVAGNFEIPALPAGAYTVIASSPGLPSAHVEDVPAGARHVVLQLREDGGWISGRVVTAGANPVASFAVIVSQAPSTLEEHPVQTRSYFDPDGRFRLGPLEPGSYAVRVGARGYAPSKPTRMQLTAGNTSETEVVLSKGGSVTGTVVDAATGRTIAGARVELEGYVIGEDLPISIEYATTTTSDGRFTLDGVPQGVRSVSATAPGYITRIASGVQVAEGSAAGPLNIQLTPAPAGGAEAKVEITGVGAVLAPERDALLVGQTAAGGGAAEAGIVAGDRIIAIDGTAVVTLDFPGAIERIRGPVGSSVALLVRRRDGQEQTITVVRRLVQGPAPPSR